MKTWLRQSISVVMALMIGLSTICWTVDKHLCWGRVVDITLFAKAQPCSVQNATPDQWAQKLQSTSCCDADSFTLQGQNQLKHTYDTPELPAPQLLPTFTQPLSTPFVPLAQRPTLHQHYIPPAVIRNVQLLNAVFLI